MIVLFLVATGGGAEAAERMAVSAKDANVRSGAGPTYGTLWKVEKYHPLEVFEASGVWLHFKDFEGDSGWIHKSLVDKTACVITKQNGVQLRAGPGTDQPVLVKIDKVCRSRCSSARAAGSRWSMPTATRDGCTTRWCGRRLRRKANLGVALHRLVTAAYDEYAS